MSRRIVFFSNALRPMADYYAHFILEEHGKFVLFELKANIVELN